MILVTAKAADGAATFLGGEENDFSPSRVEGESGGIGACDFNVHKITSFANF